MFLTAHAAVGILLSETSDDPAVVFLYGFFSHFAVDFLPHGDEDVARWIQARPKVGMIVGVIDLLFLSALLIVLYAIEPPEKMGIISAGVVGALLPDFITNIVPYLHRELSWFRFLHHANWMQKRIGLSRLWQGHDWLHTKSHNATQWYFTFWKGIVFQGIVTAVALVIFFLTTTR